MAINGLLLVAILTVYSDNLGDDLKGIHVGADVPIDRPDAEKKYRAGVGNRG